MAEGLDTKTWIGIGTMVFAGLWMYHHGMLSWFPGMSGPKAQATTASGT